MNIPGNDWMEDAPMLEATGDEFRPEPPELRPLHWPGDGRNGHHATIGGREVKIIWADDGLSWLPLWSLWIDGELIGEADEWRDPADAADEAMRIIQRDEASVKTAIRWGIPAVGLIVVLAVFGLLWVAMG